MRSALLCVFFALIVQRGNRADNDFRPMPIPINDWHEVRYDKREARGTLHGTVGTDAPHTVAAVPAHYWEDALRHSVYLTLVRDKIDQLIAKGDGIESKPDASKEVDDHDLWQKIKTAPFDRKDEEPAPPNDVTIMAKGRLMEEKGGYRFTEDERSKEKCGDDKCMEGVKAFWSVKRVRQRDMETSPGRYHYDLTFSVISQPQKKQRKPHETPVRTFTVQETAPEKVLDMPQENRSYERIQVLSTHRPERALWFHKNIVPTQHYQGRQYHHGLERIFSSLFSDDDDDYDTPQRYRPNPNPYVPPVHAQYAKVGYVGSPSDQQKRLTPYPYKPHSYKYVRPPLTPPPHPHMQHHYVEADAHGAVNNQFTSQSDYRYVTPNKMVKTTRPAVLPTPYTQAQPPKNWTVDGDNKKPNTTNNTTKAPEAVTAIYKNYNKPRPAPMKINYLPDHVRPPIYNAPPGVFVTMDKKPFKPMPPLKLIYSTKHLKSSRPIDFKPSPQVLDMKQFSEPDPLFDTPFRPITWNYSEVNTTEKIEVAESSTQINNTLKSTTKGKKPPKKHENIKSERITSTTPEIITASDDSAEENDVLEWVNVVGAFTKTTPMVSQKEKVEEPQTSTPEPTTTTVSTTTAKRRKTTTTEVVEETTTTTPKPRKRTRPPPKFTKSTEKIKKHKRITTTTTRAPEVKTTQDLTPQASSAAAINPAWNTTTKSISTMSLTTTTSSTSTTAKPTTTTTKATTTSQVPNTSTEAKSTTATTQLTAKNRFRQSTLIHKGTSVKHDKWSALSTTSATNVEKARPVKLLTSKNSRRKGSNFQGYGSSTPITDKDGKHENHSSTFKTGSTTESTYKPASTSTHHYEETADQYESTDESDDPYYSNNEEEDSDEDTELENYEQETKDHTEYIFQPSPTTHNEKTNEIIDQYEPMTTEEIITSSYTAPKNKTKCKKKKNNATTTEEVPIESNNATTSTTTTTAIPSIFDELFGGFTGEDNTEKDSKSTATPELVEQQSENHSNIAKIDDDLQDFLDSLNKGDDHSDEAGEYDDDDEQEPSIDSENSPFDNEEENASARDSPDSYDDYQDRPYSLIELMAME